MKKAIIISLVVVLGWVLTACSGQAGPTKAAVSSAPADAPSAPASGNAASSEAGLTKTKEEASVAVEVTPLNLADPSATQLDFQIALNTHSVDLSYDLTSIAALRNDAGEEVKPVKWDGPAGGGHHVSGILSFPTLKNRGQSMTLILRGIAGVAERKFTWKVN